VVQQTAAIASLSQADKGGWQNGAWTESDPDPDSIRSRAVFQGLLADLEKARLATD
jgi:hypothetical protein